MFVVRNVSFSYRSHQVFSDLSVQGSPGVIGLLGPNGAGKTTLMRLLAGELRPESGEIETEPYVGYLPQKFDLLPLATTYRNVRYAAWAQGMKGQAADDATATAIDVVGLSNRRNSLAFRLSGGMKQRLGIACVTVSRPQTLLLDEPSVGLDPEQRIGLRELLRELGRHSTVLVSTHQVADLAGIADQLIILNEGEIRFSGTLDELEALGEQTNVPHMSPLEAGYLVVTHSSFATS